MKSLSEIRGLKIISINEGRQISTVKDVVLHSDEGKLAFFIIDQPSDYLGARLIAFQDILGLGDYAVIIAESNVIRDVAHCPLAIELLQKDVRVIGSQVLTNNGSLIGQVTEVTIDEKTGKIATCQALAPHGKNIEIKCDHIIAFGKEIVIIDENPSAKIKLQNTKTPAQEQIKNTQPQSAQSNEKELLKKKIEEFSKQDSLVKAAPESHVEIVCPQDFNVFEQRQLQFLLGKSLNSDVMLDNGEYVKAGEQITAQLLSQVKSRNTLMQMTAQVVKA